MKAVKRWRYYCDHCKKGGQSPYHMRNHEAVCTLNPKRQCKMCGLIEGGNGSELPEMLALLPDPAQFMQVIPADQWSKERVILDDEKIKPLIAAVLPAMRELCQDCPVCLLAAFRQKKIPVPLVDGFNYKEEMKSMFGDINDAKREDYC